MLAREDELAARMTAEERAALELLRAGQLATDVATEERVGARAVLAARPEYVEHARAAVAAALERGRSLRTGAIPYVADRLFTPDEARVVERALVVGLEVDADWAARGVGLLREVVVAPDAARSAPSQAAAYAVARAVLEVSTPEGLFALEDAARATRHAGLAKKLARYARDARRRLVQRPEVALRVPADTDLGPRQVAGWVRTLEAALALSPTWTAQRWVETVHARPELSAPAAAVVWTVAGGPSFRGVPGSLVTADDATVVLADDAVVGLWHPAAATEQERRSWREHVVRHRVDQPFRQVFREHYGDSDRVALAGDPLPGERPVLDLAQLLGVARSEGWRIDRRSDGILERDLAGLRGRIGVRAGLAPGTAGTAPLSGVDVVGRGSAVAQSELLRSVDLLLSVSAVGLDVVASPPSPFPQTPAGVLATRRLVVGAVLAELEGGPPLRVAARHVEVGDHRVHLATARVTRDGDPVEVRPATGHGLWMPLEDRLLSRIVGLVVALHAGAGA